MATYIVTFSGSIEVEDESSEASAITYVQNNNLALGELEFEAEEVEEEEDDANLYREYEGGKEDYLYDNYVADQLEERDK
jgi:hypothetical protein